MPGDDQRTAIIEVDAVHPGRMVARDRHLLVRVQGAQLGQVMRIFGPVWRVGRAPDLELPLADTGVSRQHAQFTWESHGYALEDLGSANGTYVNGERIGQRLLGHGDIVQFGPAAAFRYDITDADEETMLRELYEASIMDSLTGAYNREYFNSRLEAELSYARRHGSELGLLMMDIDHFKQVNDRFGHQVGDFVLVEIASAISSHLRAEDVFARFGGEEFGVILRDTAADTGYAVGERFRLIVESLRVEFDGQVIPVAVSIGAASLSECAVKNAAALIEAADRRLYAAKRGGRNRVVATD
jgi:two-component system, cell cycle response regulator